MGATEWIPPRDRSEIFARSLKLEPIQQGPSGKNRCRWCGTEVQGRRQTFCSDPCVQEWLIRASPNHARHMLRERDQGLCAECGMDCEAITQSLQKLLTAARRLSQPLCQAQVYDRKLRRYRHRTPEERAAAEEPFQGAVEEFNKLAASLHAFGFTIYKPIPEQSSLVQLALRVSSMGRVRSAWEADHVKAVCEGGGACGLGNLRTLCQPCHKRSTRELARRRSQK